MVWHKHYSDGLVLLAKEELVLQGVIDRFIEIGKCYGMEVEDWKSKVMRISRQQSPVQITFDRSKTTGECGMFQLFG